MNRILVTKGDITKMAVDAIVNAANTSLLGGGGVDGAIHRAGGTVILEECKMIRNKQGGCPTGEAVITSAGNLPAKFVIHTVGPVWNGGNRGEKELLASCYRNALALAIRNNVETIAFPNISTGIYHFPKKEAADIAMAEVKKFFEKNALPRELTFVCYDEENYLIYKSLVF